MAQLVGVAFRVSSYTIGTGGNAMPIQKGSADDLEAQGVVVSFRAPRALVKQLDELARGDQRTRANLIVRILTHAVTLEPAVHVMEQILPILVKEDKKNPNSVQAEFYRGIMSGARWMIGAFFGRRAVRWVNTEVKQRTKLPMPHVVPLAADGNRYGFDSEADV
jgi:hypothetical protein